jgi:hypothetical protein
MSAENIIELQKLIKQQSCLDISASTNQSLHNNFYNRNTKLIQYTKQYTDLISPLFMGEKMTQNIDFSTGTGCFVTRFEPFVIFIHLYNWFGWGLEIRYVDVNLPNSNEFPLFNSQDNGMALYEFPDEAADAAERWFYKIENIIRFNSERNANINGFNPRSPNTEALLWQHTPPENKLY